MLYCSLTNKTDVLEKQKISSYYGNRLLHTTQTNLHYKDGYLLLLGNNDGFYITDKNAITTPQDKMLVVVYNNDLQESIKEIIEVNIKTLNIDDVVFITDFIKQDGCYITNNIKDLLQNNVHIELISPKRL